MAKYLDSDGVLYLWGKIKSLVSGAVPTKTSDLTNDSGFVADSSYVHTDNNYTTTEKNKLSGIASGADANLPISVSGTDKEITSLALSTVMDIEGIIITFADSSSTFVPDGMGLNAVLTGINTDLGDKVDKEDGKGLSSNDYTTTEKNKLAAFSAASNYALKSDITNMYKYKGSVATVSALPSSGQTTGDVYNVEATGMNYAWNGTAWDALGEIFTITAITNSELDTICV